MKSDTSWKGFTEAAEQPLEQNNGQFVSGRVVGGVFCFWQTRSYFYFMKKPTNGCFLWKSDIFTVVETEQSLFLHEFIRIFFYNQMRSETVGKGGEHETNLGPLCRHMEDHKKDMH